MSHRLAWAAAATAYAALWRAAYRNVTAPIPRQLGR